MIFVLNKKKYQRCIGATESDVSCTVFWCITTETKWPTQRSNRRIVCDVYVNIKWNDIENLFHFFFVFSFYRAHCIVLFCFSFILLSSILLFIFAKGMSKLVDRTQCIWSSVLLSGGIVRLLRYFNGFYVYHYYYFCRFYFAHTWPLIVCVVCVRPQLGLNSFFVFIMFGTYTNGLCMRVWIRVYQSKKRLPSVRQRRIFE